MSPPTIADANGAADADRVQVDSVTGLSRSNGWYILPSDPLVALDQVATHGLFDQYATVRRNRHSEGPGLGYRQILF